MPNNSLRASIFCMISIFLNYCLYQPRKYSYKHKLLFTFGYNKYAQIELRIFAI